MTTLWQYLSIRATARLIDKEPVYVRRYVKSHFESATNTGILQAEIPTGQGLRTATLLPENIILGVIAKYKPELLLAFAQLGLRSWLYEQAGYTKSETPTKDFSVVITWAAIQGNEKAASLVAATLNETLERRIDNALGESVTEETYEDRTKAFFRELSRKAFHPKFTTWNDSNVNYGAMVNEYKKYMSLPLVNIDQYNQQQISVWYEGIVLYNSYRYEGYCHKVALEKTRMILADCD